MKRGAFKPTATWVLVALDDVLEQYTDKRLYQIQKMIRYELECRGQ